ncbi:MAG: Na+-dependent transporter [Polyangiaceae bacterium]|nr:Na+-dependent transporter [Polyangiaceae bacterium]
MTAAKWLMLAVQASIFLTVVALGLRARFRDAASLLRRPGALSRALLSMYVLMPALAVLLALAFDLKPIVGFVLVALSLAPVPPLLPRKTGKAGGDPTYVISLLAIAAVLSIVLIPVGLRIVSAITGNETRVEMAHVIKGVLVGVLIPLTLGMAVRWRFPRFAARAAKPMGRVALVLLVASIPFLFVFAWPKVPGLIGDGTILTMVIFVAGGLAAGHFIGGPDAHERADLALACGARHPGIAFTLGSMNFTEPKLVMGAVLLYLIVAAVVAIPYIVLQKRRHPVARDLGYR